MSRLLKTSLALTVVALLPACKKGSSVDPVELVPDKAGLMGSVDMKALMASSVYQSNKAAFEEDEQAKKFFAGARECNLDPSGFSGVTFALQSSTEDGVAIFKGKGVGKKDNLTCVQGKIKEAEGEDPWTFAEHDGKPVLEIAGGKTIGYMVGDDMLALVTPGWESDLRQLLDGKGTPAVKGTLKDLYSRADKKKPVWFAGVAPKEILDNLDDGPAKAIKDFNGSLDVSSGLGLRLAGGTESEEAAGKLQAEAQKQFDAVKPLAPMLGVPATILDTVKFSVEGTSMVATANIPEAELQNIRDRLQGKAPAAGGAPGAPPAGVMAEGEGKAAAPAEAAEDAKEEAAE